MVVTTSKSLVSGLLPFRLPPFCVIVYKIVIPEISWRKAILDYAIDHMRFCSNAAIDRWHDLKLLRRAYLDLMRETLLMS